MLFRIFFLPWITRTCLLQNGLCTRAMVPILHQTAISWHLHRHQRHSQRRQRILCPLIQKGGTHNPTSTLVAITINSRSITINIRTRTHIGKLPTPGEKRSLSSLAKLKCNHLSYPFKTIYTTTLSHPQRLPPPHLPSQPLQLPILLSVFPIYNLIRLCIYSTHNYS